MISDHIKAAITLIQYRKQLLEDAKARQKVTNKLVSRCKKTLKEAEQYLESAQLNLPL